jgi:hypothetical protein
MEKRDNPRSIRIPTPEWEKLKRLGMQWLIRQIRRAREHQHGPKA